MSKESSAKCGEVRRQLQRPCKSSALREETRLSTSYLDGVFGVSAAGQGRGGYSCCLSCFFGSPNSSATRV